MTLDWLAVTFKQETETRLGTPAYVLLYRLTSYMWGSLECMDGLSGTPCLLKTTSIHQRRTVMISQCKVPEVLSFHEQSVCCNDPVGDEIDPSNDYDITTKVLC